MVPGCILDGQGHRPPGHLGLDATVPIVLSDCASNHDVPKADDELVCPQQTKQVVRKHVLRARSPLSASSYTCPDTDLRSPPANTNLRNAQW